MTSHLVLRCVVVAIALAGLVYPATTRAQTTPKGQPNAVQGFSQNRDKPIVVNAERMERREKDKSVVVSGNVRVVQGDTTLRAKSLVVFTDAAPASGKAATPAKAATKSVMPGGGSEQISKIEARGGVTVTQKDQVVTGENGVYDVRAGLITMTGNVLMTQDKNVLRGDRLVVNINTGDAQVECDGGRSCFQGIFNTEQKGGSGSGPAGILPGAPARPKQNEPQRLTPR